MAIEHKDIADPYIGEPKGASTATAGQVYKANGSGSGVWSDTAFNVHGDMIIESGTTGIVTSAAADATLNTDSDYVKITGDWSVGHVDGITFNTDELVVPVAGGYEVFFWADILVPKNNNFIGIKYAINDTTPYSTRKIISQSNTTNDYLNMFGAGIVTPLAATNTISMYIASTQADSLIVQEAGLVVKLLDAL